MEIHIVIIKLSALKSHVNLGAFKRIDAIGAPYYLGVRFSNQWFLGEKLQLISISMAWNPSPLMTRLITILGNLFRLGNAGSYWKFLMY